jgi:hypothetical protein
VGRTILSSLPGSAPALDFFSVDIRYNRVTVPVCHESDASSYRGALIMSLERGNN